MGLLLYLTHRGIHLRVFNSYHPLPPALHLLSFSASTDMARTGGTSSNANRPNRPHPQNPTQRARTFSQSQSRRSSMYRASIHSSSTQATLHLSWLLRSNLPPRRGMQSPLDVQKRRFFGVGEIIGVLANVCIILLERIYSTHLLDPARRNPSLPFGVEKAARRCKTGAR